MCTFSVVCNYDSHFILYMYMYINLFTCTCTYMSGIQCCPLDDLLLYMYMYIFVVIHVHVYTLYMCTFSVVCNYDSHFI